MSISRVDFKTTVGGNLEVRIDGLLIHGVQRIEVTAGRLEPTMVRLEMFAHVGRSGEQDETDGWP